MQPVDRTEDTIPSPRIVSGHRGTRSDPESTRRPIPIFAWVVGFVAGALMLAVCSLWGLYLFRGGIPDRGGPSPTPVILTASPAPSSAATMTPAPSETAEPVPTLSPDIAIGRYVQVTGTEGSGLSLRAGPGENYTRVDVALDGQVFIIVEGPVHSGDSVWWQIRDLDDSDREWWAAGNYLEPVEHP